MIDENRRHGIKVLAIFFSLPFVFLLWHGCGGGGGGGSSGPPPSTSITGSVSGTIVLAIDETGNIAARDDTAGKPPIPNTTPPRKPFTLNVPHGHQYHMYFIVNEGTPTERIVPLTFGTTNVFSVGSAPSIDLGFVDTSAAQATAEKNPFAVSGVTPGPETGPPTIRVEGYKYFVLLDNFNGVKRYRAQVQVKDAAGNVLTNGSLVKGMKIYSPTGAELPPDGSFFHFNGSGSSTDTGVAIVSNPFSDLEVYLAAAPGSLSGGFYTAVVTDNNGNLYSSKPYFETPAEVGKPTGLSQVVNADNSITLSWTNPSGISAPAYLVYVYVLSDDGNGDGQQDLPLLLQRSATTNIYTIPANFVQTALSGKTGLKWMVEIRQQTTTPVIFPDGTSSTAQFYRTRSAQTTLTLPTPTGPGQFTAEMLAGKVFFREFPVGDFGLYEFSLFFFNTDFSFRNSSSTNALNPAVEILNGTWSIDASGRMIVKIPGFPQDVIGTLLSDNPTEMQISVEGIDAPGIEIFQKTVPIDPSKLPGTYTEPDGTAIINPGGTGSFNGEPITWSVDSAGVLTIPTPTEKNICYALASSSSTSTSYTILKLVGEELNLDGSVHNIFKAVLTRNP